MSIFAPPFVQRALVEIALLALVAGVVGTWIVLRGMSFYAHAVGTAAFPGLVAADGLGFSPLLGAAGTAAVVATIVAVLARCQPESYDSLAALALVGALAVGILLASDVFHSAGNVEQLLFGSLLLVGGVDQLVTGTVAIAAIAAGLLIGRRWLAIGMDAGGARALGVRPLVPDLVLLVLIAASAVAALDAIGALLATAMLVVPAATTRLWCDRIGPWQLATVALAAAEGVVGLYASVRLNAPPGATIAVVGGLVFAGTVLARAVPRWTLAVGGVAMLTIGAGCGGSADGSAAPGGAAIKVVATTTQMGDITSAIGGDAVDVTTILRPNTDPHDYEPRPGDVSSTSGAKVVVTSGDNIDQWMGKVLDNAGGSAAVLDAGAGRPDTLPGESSGGEASEYDPHWWHDPVNVEYAVKRIRDALVKGDPGARDAIEEGAADYLAKLKTLDTGIETCMDTVPADQRKLVTDHDAFGYFAKRYDVTIVGAVIPSQTTQAQPSAGDLSKLVALIKREHVSAVFPESSINPRLAQAIASESGASAGYTLYGDTLGPAGSPGETYLTMERANANAMVRGFTSGARGCSISGI